MTERIVGVEKESAVESNLTEEYMANAYLVENLRKQSNKVEKIIKADRGNSRLC